MRKIEFDCEKVKELYAQKFSIAKIAKEINAPKNSINKFLRDEGLIKKVLIGKISEEEKLKCEDLFKQGYNTTEISKITNHHIKSVQTYLKSLGYVLNRKNLNKKSFDLKIEISKLYMQGLSLKEIGEKINLSEKTISYHIRNLGLNNSQIIKEKKDIFKKKIADLYESGKTIREICKEIGSSRFTVGEIVKDAGLSRKSFPEANSDLKLSYLQEQFILGSCLGDMNIQIGKKAANAKLSIVHCEKQKELFMAKVELLGDFMGSYRYSEGIVDSRTDKKYPSYRGNSLSHPEFTRLYNIIYPNGKKKITQEYVDMITHPIALAFWFMDDGSNVGVIATNSFELEEIEILINLLNKFNINNISIQLTNKNQYLLNILSSSREKFDTLIKPYMVEDMKYKLKYK